MSGMHSRSALSCLGADGARARILKNSFFVVLRTLDVRRGCGFSRQRLGCPSALADICKPRARQGDACSISAYGWTMHTMLPL